MKQEQHLEHPQQAHSNCLFRRECSKGSQDRQTERYNNNDGNDDDDDDIVQLLLVCGSCWVNDRPEWDSK